MSDGIHYGEPGFAGPPKSPGPGFLPPLPPPLAGPVSFPWTPASIVPTSLLREKDREFLYFSGQMTGFSVARRRISGIMFFQGLTSSTIRLLAGIISFPWTPLGIISFPWTPLGITSFPWTPLGSSPSHDPTYLIDSMIHNTYVTMVHVYVFDLSSWLLVIHLFNVQVCLLLTSNVHFLHPT